MSTDRATLADTILRLCAERGAEKSICPSEVARALAGNDEKIWRLLMHPIREAAMALAREGRIAVLRKGKPVPVDDPVRGVIRLALPRG
ncbi:DUF3253 domain-containing protein [Elioraea sp.]|uniref:DUF3253 domain-containing protein n=1 Tax=Elioraea sp. TaxID=2185103 RepID=UPI0025C3ACC4|nr:DUF3253 domain-containing protein [Elioraea sp.]